MTEFSPPEIQGAPNIWVLPNPDARCWQKKLPFLARKCQPWPWLEIVFPPPLPTRAGQNATAVVREAGVSRHHEDQFYPPPPSNPSHITSL